MKQILSKYGYTVFFLYMAIFYCFLYNYHLLYTEQLQIFQYSELYFHSLIGKPGGLANYIGTFVMQFYIWNHVGGLLITAALWFLFFLLKKIGNAWNLDINDAFALLPIAAFALFYMNVNAHFGGLVAVILALLFVYALSKLPDNRLKFIIAWLLVPVVYACTGGGLLLYTLMLVTGNLIKGKQNFIFIVILLLSTLVLPLSVRQYWLSLSWTDTWIGNAFYLGDNVPDRIWILLSVPVSVPLLAAFTGRFGKKTTQTGLISFGMTCCVTGGTILTMQYKRNTHEEIIYALDHLLKKEDWNQMLRIAEKHPQRNLLFVSYTNLALLNNGQLPDKLLQFSQRPEVNEFWTSSYLPMFLTAETYYHLNMEDAARAYYFMANTQSPVAQTPFMYKRLAELETVRGNAKAGMKYVQILKNSLFYKDWAVKMEQSLASGSYPEKIQVKIDRYIENDSFLAKEMLYNVSCKQHKTPENEKVRDFLLAKYILANDYKGFIYCIAGLSNGIGREFPRTYQEFLLMYAYMLHDSTLIEKWKIRQDVVSDFYKYLQINQSGQPADVIKAKLSEAYRHTYWYYTQYKNEF